MSSRFSSRAPASHLASTAGTLRDQPRHHRCNHSEYTSRSAFSAVTRLGGARIVVVSAPPSDPCGGRREALKAQPPRAAPDECGLSRRAGAAHSHPGQLPSDAAQWGVRVPPRGSSPEAGLRGSSWAVRRTETPRRNGQRAASQVHAAHPGGCDDCTSSRRDCSIAVVTGETRGGNVLGSLSRSLLGAQAPPRRPLESRYRFVTEQPRMLQRVWRT